MVGIYFSGTGGTRYCLSKFMEETSKGEIFSIEDENCIEQIKNHDRIIFAYPVYFSTLPIFVRDFIEKSASLWQGKKVYVIATMGMFSGDGSGYPARLFKKFGAEIIGGLHLKLPDSISDEKSFAKPAEENIKLLNLAEEKIKTAATLFLGGNPTQEGLGLFSHILGLLGQRLWFGFKTKKYSDKLKINENCISCAKCINLCPTNNLEIKNGKAYANGKCTMCYRCINMCPSRCITLLGNTVYKQYKITDRFVSLFLNENIK